MRILLSLFFLIPITIYSQDWSVGEEPLRWLALGDSYTIGQGVSSEGNWPNQLRDSLVRSGFRIDTLLIDARTGRTTGDLLDIVKAKNYGAQEFTLVSLCIGVNDQFQGLPRARFENQLHELFDSVLSYVNHDPSHIIALSIPDYAYTPFGQRNNPGHISREIDSFNVIKQRVANSFGVSLIDVTSISRLGLSAPLWVAADGLHPSVRQYTSWVSLILDELRPTSSVQQYQWDFTLYPNPSSDYIHLSVNGCKRAETITIFSLSGNRVWHNTDVALPSNIVLHSIEPGWYIIKVKCRAQVIRVPFLKYKPL